MRASSNLRSLPFRGLVALSFLKFALITGLIQAQTLYDFGNPGADEQLYIEDINRARANPPAEGARLAATTDPQVLSAYTYFGVSLSTMQSEFNAIAAQPPLAPNAILTGTARGHSAWMFSTITQAHNESATNTPYTRMSDAGYNYVSAGENIYAWAESPWYGHAGFEVDWGTGTGGMQTGRGHRVNIHSASFREIGVGVVNGTNGVYPNDVGPQLVTQDFGARSSSPTFGTGVAYYDLNGNNFYDVGEGIAGLTVNVSGASYYCATAAGGGWVVPVPTSAATRTVTFSGLNVNQTVNITFPSSTNAKADLKLTYTPPAITSSASTFSGTAHNLAFTAVGGATGYRWNRWNLATAAAENCESTANVTLSANSGYSVSSTSTKQQGTASFHLVNATGLSEQSIQLNSLYFGQSSPALSFQSLIRYSTTSETFKVQVKEDSGTVWQDVFTQTGTNTSGEAAFSLRSAALSAMTGKAFRVRFLLNPGNGSHYTDTSDIVGWFIDAISFTNVSTLQNNQSQILATNSGSFTPSTGTYLMSVTPVISGLDFPASYQTLVVSDPPPSANPTFDTWAADRESEHALPAGSLADPNGDYDHDGRSNLLEYAFGGDPAVGNDPMPGLPAASTTDTLLVLQYQRDTSLTDLTYTPQTCSNLGNWISINDAGAPAGFLDSTLSTTGSIETHQVTLPLDTTNRFLRVRISRP